MFPTLDDVREAALSLMDRDGSTTPEDVFYRLHTAGFRTDHEEVAALLDVLASLETWSVTIEQSIIHYGPAVADLADEPVPGIWIRLFLN